MKKEDKKMDTIIVSRHPAAIEFIARFLGCEVSADGQVVADDFGKEHEGFSARVIASATADDVNGKIVIGNLPLHLAVHAAQVWAIEFPAAPPRGQEYTIEDMVAAGVTISKYVVSKV